jgi:hypothetical protein
VLFEDITSQSEKKGEEEETTEKFSEVHPVVGQKRKAAGTT